MTTLDKLDAGSRFDRQALRAEMAVTTQAAGYAVLNAVRGESKNEAAWTARAAVELDALLAILDRVDPHLVPYNELMSMAKVGYEAMTTGTSDLGLKGSRAFSRALDVASVQVTAHLHTTALPEVKAAIRVLEQLGPVRAMVAEGGVVMIEAGTAKKCVSQVSSGALSRYYESADAGVLLTLQDLQKKGVGIAVDDPATGHRKPVTWNGTQFVDAQWNEAKKNWVPKSAS